MSGVRPTLHTARLVLRAPTTRDRDALVALAGEREVSRWLARVPHPYTHADADAFLALAEDETVWAIADRTSDALMGTITLAPLDNPDEPGAAELGYWLGRPFWGQGYGAEAVARILAHAFEERAVPAVRARYVGDNAASAGLLRKFGFEAVAVPTIPPEDCTAMCDTEVVLRRP